MEKLAIYGGAKSINLPSPHYTWPKITDQVKDAVVEQLYSDISIPGVSGIFSDFEAEFATFHDRRYSVLFNSGTSALYAAFMALELKPGDSVIIPDYTFFATASPLLYFPVDLRFADCDKNGNVSVNTIESLIDDTTRAVVITHMWGIPCETDEIAFFCKKNGLTLIEDCSHAHGARFRDQVCGSFGDIAVWSLQGQKVISGGEGGILLTDSARMRDIAVLTGHYGQRAKAVISRENSLSAFRTTGFGMKLRAHPLAIAIAKQQFSQLENYLEVKQGNAERLLDLLSGYSFIHLPDLTNRRPSWYSFTFRVKDPLHRFNVSDFFDALFAEGCLEIDRPGSTRNISVYPIFNGQFRDFGLVATSSNVSKRRRGAENFYEEAIKLPIWATIEDSEVFSQYLAAMKKVCDYFEKEPML